MIKLNTLNTPLRIAHRPSQCGSVVLIQKSRQRTSNYRWYEDYRLNGVTEIFPFLSKLSVRPECGIWKVYASEHDAFNLTVATKSNAKDT